MNAEQSTHIYVVVATLPEVWQNVALIEFLRIIVISSRRSPHPCTWLILIKEQLH